MSQPPPSPAKQRAAHARCAAMVRHAREQIMTHGVQRFSVNEVLRLSGGSKATLAKYFGDKAGLVAAAIGEEARETMEALDLDLRGDPGLSLPEGLTRLLDGVLRFYLQPPALALYRAVIADAGNDAQGARAFYEHGHSAVVGAIAGFLDARKGHGVVQGLDSRSAADRMVHAIRAGTYEQALLGLVPLPVPETLIAEQAAQTVALMLPGISAPSTP